ncbi:hypothetical protein [Paraburkholderia sp. HD33-4]|uniref:hypothetical protein n=1 Tax=Paraburkholderia sp. HD33-4 TaxID=2883242 RepID=UPI001F226D13|nr:hypothetical protein [Paraburkholderia sp. HD33-4]
MSGTPTQARRNGGDHGHRTENTDRNQAPRFHVWRLLIATLATPLAWFAQMLIGEVLTAQSCALSDPNHPVTPPSWVITALIALSAVCFVVGVAGIVVAWRTVAFTRAQLQQSLQGRAHRVAELEAFLARIGVLSSAIFMFGLIVTSIAVAMVSWCGRW